MKLVAVAGWWREPEWLVDELRQNLAWVDELVIVDDRSRSGGWGHEGEYRLRQRRMCSDAGADWVLVTSPDERWEDRAGATIRRLVDTGPRDVVYRFPQREMWTPTAYRVDGQWSHRRRTRLYPLVAGQRMAYKPIHCPPQPIHPHYRKIDVDVRLYHLKMIEPENRPARRAAYAAADKAAGLVRRHQWQHLVREDGLRLETLPAGRGFTPPYTRTYRFEAG